MPDMSQLEAKILKDVKEAESGLKGLNKAIQPAVKNIHKREIDQAKADRAAKLVLTFMGKHKSITKIQTTPAYGQLSPSAQAQVDWMDELMGELLKLFGLLTKTRKQSKMDPDKQTKILVKSSKEVFTQLRTAPRGVGTLIKEIQKGNDIGGLQGGLIAFLPMALMLWLIMDTITRGLAKRPRG